MRCKTAQTCRKRFVKVNLPGPTTLGSAIGVKNVIAEKQVLAPMQELKLMKNKFGLMT